MRTNCLPEAFRRWWREGGIFAFQPSRWGAFAHFMFKPIDGDWKEFTKEHKKHQVFPPLLFEGAWQPLTLDPPRKSFSSLSTRSPISRLAWLLWLPLLVTYFAAVMLYVGWSEILFGD